MLSKKEKKVLFWINLLWLPLVGLAAYQGWPNSYGSEFGVFLIEIAFMGLAPFGGLALYFHLRTSYSNELLRRIAISRADEVVRDAIRKAKS